MRDDDARKAILARRARFIAAAMMGAGLASCERVNTEPTSCLSLSEVPADAAPQPCLSPPVLPPDGTGATADGGARDSAGNPPDAGGADADLDGGAPGAQPTLPPRPVPVSPRPCLKPGPRICLKFKP